MIQKIIEFIKPRLFKSSTVIGIILLHVEINHSGALNKVVPFLIGEAGKQLIMNIVNNDIFINALVGSIVVFLFGTKKF